MPILYFDEFVLLGAVHTIYMYCTAPCQNTGSTQWSTLWRVGVHWIQLKRGETRDGADCIECLNDARTHNTGIWIGHICIYCSSMLVCCWCLLAAKAWNSQLSATRRIRGKGCPFRVFGKHFNAFGRYETGYKNDVGLKQQIRVRISSNRCFILAALRSMWPLLLRALGITPYIFPWKVHTYIYISSSSCMCRKDQEKERKGRVRKKGLNNMWMHKMLASCCSHC